MAMPNHLVMVRHGNSEANVIQARFKADPEAEAPEGFFDRHDSRMRLSSLGREQAAAAGEWLQEEFPEGFDRYYVSTLARTKETAGRMALKGAEWVEDDRWRERDWGEFGTLNESQQIDLYELSHRLKGQHRWYWCPPGGESLATGVRLRFEDILDTLHREAENQQVVAVTHGETIDVARFVLERMNPEEWLEDNHNPARKVGNCQIFDYTKVSPYTGEVAGQIRWYRSVCPWDPSRSWNGGDWIDIPPRKRFTNEELLASVAKFPLLLEPEPTSTD
jgi:broad specificity phosphatase PhoE